VERDAVKVLVVGGGVIGCAIAFELAKAGCAVTLIERGMPGAEASGAAAGLLSPLSDCPVPGYRDLAIASWRLYPGVVRELRERTGIDVEHVSRGSLHPLYTAADVREAHARVAWALGMEFGVEAWDSAEVHAREPALSSKVGGAMFVRADHWVNNERLVVAYATASAGAGVVLLTGRGVSRVIVEDGHARGVVVEGERLDCDAVIVAAGAWTAALCASFGGRLPLEPRRGQMLALAHVPAILTHAIHGEDLYLVPRPSGELLVGATVERVGFHRAVTAEGIAGLLAAAIDLVPGLAGLPITRTWYGFRPWAPDSRPIIGPWPGISGLWVATAHYRSGILLAPITGRLVSESIMRGQPSPQLEDFLPDRFLRSDRT
jgi:glycine oxidase